MILYHGTTSVFLEKILKEGLRCLDSFDFGVYLTNSKEDALGFAKYQIEKQKWIDKSGGEPVVLSVDVPEEKLEKGIREGTFIYHGNPIMNIKVVGKKASIIDYPRETLDPDVWIQSKESITLQPKVEQTLLDSVFSALDDLDLDEDSLKELYVYGSILTTQYTNSSDIDSRIVLKKEPVNEKYPELIGEDLADFLGEAIKGVKIEGSDHVINFSIII
jgi:predicted nucleotidyltransferase